jgi:hypothetical protein
MAAMTSPSTTYFRGRDVICPEDHGPTHRIQNTKVIRDRIPTQKENKNRFFL